MTGDGCAGWRKWFVTDTDTTETKRQALANNNYGTTQRCPFNDETYKDHQLRMQAQSLGR